MSDQYRSSILVKGHRTFIIVVYTYIIYALECSTPTALSTTLSESHPLTRPNHPLSHTPCADEPLQHTQRLLRRRRPPRLARPPARTDGLCALEIRNSSQQPFVATQAQHKVVCRILLALHHPRQTDASSRHPRAPGATRAAPVQRRVLDGPGGVENNPECGRARDVVRKDEERVGAGDDAEAKALADRVENVVLRFGGLTPGPGAVGRGGSGGCPVSPDDGGLTLFHVGTGRALGELPVRTVSARGPKGVVKESI
jgi:hypothetical protein